MATAREDDAWDKSVAKRLDEPVAFAAFYDATLPRIYGYFFHRCGGITATAEDLTQETYLAAVRELRQGITPVTPLPWLYGIARHKLLDHYRATNRRESEVSPLGDESDAIPDPSLDLARSEDRLRLAAALAGLPESQRAAVTLHHVDGLSVAEVARHLEKSPTAVESLLARGRATLKRLLQEEDGHV